MCSSSLTLGLGGGNCSTMGLRPALTTAHSGFAIGFESFKELNHSVSGRLPNCENFRVRRMEFAEARGGFAGSSRDGVVEGWSTCCRRGVGQSVGRGTGRGNFSVLCRAKKRDVSVERSDRANEELLMFFFQLDLTTRLQRALNQDMYEAAQGLREKIAEVEREMARQRKAKTGSGSSKNEAHDTAITLLQTKAELQKLIEDEDYAAAGALRNKIMALEAESLAAQANAMIYQQRSFQYRLGQKVKHRALGYRGVICGMDPLCCESDEWADAVGVEELPRGRNQPFYQVLVDIREEPSVMVTYVAEDNLVAPEEPDFEQFDHPYVYFLFYGMDGAGDFIACKQLREKYDAPRHELPYEEKEGD